MPQDNEKTEETGKRVSGLKRWWLARKAKRAASEKEKETRTWEQERAEQAATAAIKLAQKEEKIAQTQAELEKTIQQGGFWGFVARLQQIVAQVLQLRPLRAYFRYGAVRGNLLAGGFAYTALFSLAGVITLVITLCRWFLASNEEYQHRVFSAVNEWLPGAITLDGQEGLIDPASITTGSFTLTGVIGIVVLVLAGYRMMVALRLSIQAIFGLAPRSAAWWQDPLRDFTMFILLGVAFTVSLGLSTATVVASQSVLSWLGWHWSGWSAVIRVVSSLLTILVDAVTVIMLIRFLALVRAPRRDLWVCSLLMSLISFGLRLAGTAVVTSSANQPAIAPFAIIVTLMLWVNLFARLLLLVCAVLANPPAAPAPDATVEEAKTVPNYVTQSFPHTLSWPHDPLNGQLFTQNPADEASPIYNRYPALLATVSKDAPTAGGASQTKE